MTGITVMGIKINLDKEMETLPEAHRVIVMREG